MPCSILKYLPKNSLACIRKPGLPSITEGVTKSDEGFEPPKDILETPCEGDTIERDGTVSMNNPNAFALEVPKGQGVLSDYDLLLTQVCRGIASPVTTSQFMSMALLAKDRSSASRS